MKTILNKLIKFLFPPNPWEIKMNEEIEKHIDEQLNKQKNEK